MKRKAVLWPIIVAVLVTAVAFSTVEIVNWWNESRLIDHEAEEIANDFLVIADVTDETEPPLEQIIPEEEIEEETSHNTEPAKTSGTSSIALDYDKLKAINPEAAGWIRIEGTKVNHPVMQATDNSKYMDRNIYGKNSRAGTPFLDCTNNLQPNDDNLVIYGHNMGTGRTSVFSTLTSYKRKSQWDRNSIIELNLLGVTSQWRIFAVMEFNIEDMENFNYTSHNFLTATDKVSFVQEAMNRSIYDTGIELAGEDNLLTLSTCDRSRYGKKGRLVIMAVQER